MSTQPGTDARQIARRAITHLFWGRFPFKVETIYPASNFTPTRYPIRSISTEGMRLEHRRYNKAVSMFRRACMKYTPDSAETWKLYEVTRSFHFYFLHRADMERFVAGNRCRVQKIHEPFDDADVARLAGTKDTLIRPKLFFNALKHCVTFKYNTPVEELDSWVSDMFGEDNENIIYSCYGTRRLYLNFENDILMTRLAFSRYISRVQTIILRSDIADECAFSETAG